MIYSFIGISIISFLVFAHHMFIIGISLMTRIYFSSATLIVAAHTAIDWNINTIYRLLLTSKDVIHSFAMPSLGVKADCFPGRTTTTTIKSIIKGIYFGNCSELCGPMHYNMSFQIYFR